jgi:DNA-binding transcriptional MerR regulator
MNDETTDDEIVAMAAATQWIGAGLAAELIGCHTSTLRGWGERDEIPSRQDRPGAKRKYRLDAVLARAEARRLIEARRAKK